jgi:hypothetical protein
LNFLDSPGALFCLSGKALCLLLAAAAAGTPSQAAPLDELRSLSQLRNVDLARLKGGEIVSARGPVGDFPRGIHLECCYFINAPMDVVGHALLHWDPIPHKNLKVRRYREFSLPSGPNSFQMVQLDPAVADDRWLLEETARVSQSSAAGDLHLTNEEVALLHEKSMGPSEAWREILRRRSEALARGGLNAVAPYGTDESISPGSEFRGLLTLAPKAARHFRPITGAQPMVSAGEPASETVGFWEAFKARDHNILQLGLFAGRKESDSWQLIDCVYYPSDTYFMALDLFQLWPVDGGTLVWQVGFVSAPFRVYLGGLDRFIAGKLMMQATLDTIIAFRSDIEKGR